MPLQRLSFRACFETARHQEPGGGNRGGGNPDGLLEPVFGVFHNAQPDLFGARFKLTGNHRRLGADSTEESD